MVKLIRQIAGSTILFLLAFSAAAATVLEAPDVTEHRTSLLLDIKGTRWTIDGKCFSGLVEAQNQSSRDTRLHVVVNGDGSYRKRVLVPAGQAVRFPVNIPVFNSRHSWRGYSVEFRQDGDSERYHWGNLNDYSYGHRDIPLLRPRNIADLPVNSRQYWPYPTLSLTTTQWSGLDAPRRDAIFSWLKIGGNLHLTGGTQGDVAAILAARPPPFAGIGNYLMGSITAGAEPEQGRSGLACLESDMKLKPSWKVVGISAWKFIPFVVIFAIALGPGTVWYCHRRKRPALALLVIPSVSLLSCLIILSFSLLRDGITPKVCRQTLTMLDQRDGTAITGQVLGIEAPLGGFGAITFPEEALVLLPGGNNISPRVEAAGGQLFVRGTVLARTPTFFAMLHQEHRRERLDVRRESDAVHVVNGLGATVERLSLCDADDIFWHNALPIPPGDEAVLRRGRGENAAAFSLPATFSSLKLSPVRNASEPERGGYVAHLGDQAFGVPGITGGRAVGDGFNLVVGRYE